MNLFTSLRNTKTFGSTKYYRVKYGKTGKNAQVLCWKIVQSSEMKKYFKILSQNAIFCSYYICNTFFVAGVVFLRGVKQTHPPSAIPSTGAWVKCTVRAWCRLCLGPAMYVGHFLQGLYANKVPKMVKRKKRAAKVFWHKLYTPQGDACLEVCCFFMQYIDEFGGAAYGKTCSTSADWRIWTATDRVAILPHGKSCTRAARPYGAGTTALRRHSYGVKAKSIGGMFERNCPECGLFIRKIDGSNGGRTMKKEQWIDTCWLVVNTLFLITMFVGKLAVLSFVIWAGALLFIAYLRKDTSKVIATIYVILAVAVVGFLVYTQFFMPRP